MDLLLVIIIVIITRGNNMRLQLQRLLSESGINQLIRHGQGVMYCHEWPVCVLGRREEIQETNVAINLFYDHINSN